MKNKGMIALVLGVICALILSGVLIKAAFDKDPENTPLPDADKNDTSSQDSSSEQQDPVVPDNQESNPPAQDPEEKPEEKDPSEQKPEEKDPVSETPSQPSTDKKVDPNPTTIEGIKALLNDPLLMLVNRDHKVTSEFGGLDLVSYNSDHKLNRTAAEALKNLIAAGKAEGYTYILYSGYRTYSRQYNNYYNKIDYWKNQGKSDEEALRLTNQYYAPPGASEHQTGLAADVCISRIVNEYACLHEDYAFTEEFKWFSTHAHEYGFILRYRLGDEDITGYSYEPWHYRYVGVEVATEIYERDITFEEYIEDLEARLADLEK